MRKLLKNKKALSPVVAAIILIAVTVAVSIAVAAWMGSLTIGFMETAEVTITETEFVAGTPGYLNITLTNSGTSAATVSSAKVNSQSIDVTDFTIDEGTTIADAIQLSINFAAGNKYAVSVFAKDGTLLASTTVTADATSTGA